MKISVIILNWNRADETVDTAQTVLRQDYSDFDLLIFDNASRDDSVRILQSRLGPDPRVRIHAADANYGVAGGRNRAFPLTNGDLVVFLDNDAPFAGSNDLRAIARVMNEHPDIGSVSFEVVRPDGFLMWPFRRPASEWRDKTFETTRVDGGAFAIRREAFQKAGLFAEHFSPYGAEDAHFAYKLMSHGYRILYLPEVRVIHATSPTARSKDQFVHHTRNCLWIPMELFPFPYNLLSTLNMARHLLGDAIEQQRIASFLKGILLAIFRFRWSRRTPVPRPEWKRIRRLMQAPE